MASRTPPTRRATTTATATMSTSRDCPGLSLTGSAASPISPIDLIASDVSLAGEAPKPTKEGRSGREHDALRLSLDPPIRGERIGVQVRQIVGRRRGPERAHSENA